MHDSNIRHKILTIPGLYNSGPTHWQSLWERALYRLRARRTRQLGRTAEG